MPYPTPAEVKAQLALAGVDASAFSDEIVTSQIAAAVATLETVTGWHPFLATEKTVDVDPPGRLRGGSFYSATGGRATLPSGLLSVPTVSLGGHTPEAGTYFAYPTGARPTSIRFAGAVSGAPGSLSVTGTFGYALDLPADVYDAVLKMAAGMLISTERERILAEGLSSWEEGGVKESRGYEMTLAIGSGWTGTNGATPTGAYAVFARYRRMDLY